MKSKKIIICSIARIFNYVKKNHTKLETYVADLNRNFSYVDQYRYNNWDVDYNIDTNVVQFTTTVFGIATSETINGFYYSPNDKPMGFYGKEVDLKKHGKGYDTSKVNRLNTKICYFRGVFWSILFHKSFLILIRHENNYHQ